MENEIFSKRINMEKDYPEPLMTAAECYDKITHTKNIGERLDIIYSSVNFWMTGGFWSQCDDLINMFRSEAHEPEIILGVLTITNPAAKHLAYRTSLLNETKHNFKRKFGKYRARQMLLGL